MVPHWVSSTGTATSQIQICSFSWITTPVNNYDLIKVGDVLELFFSRIVIQPHGIRWNPLDANYFDDNADSKAVHGRKRAWPRNGQFPHLVEEREAEACCCSNCGCQTLCHWPFSNSFLCPNIWYFHISIYVSIFPYLSAYMKREFQKDVSPQMQVWWAALHLGECILDNFFFSSQRINTTPNFFLPQRFNTTLRKIIFGYFLTFQRITN